MCCVINRQHPAGPGPPVGLPRSTGANTAKGASVRRGRCFSFAGTVSVGEGVEGAPTLPLRAVARRTAFHGGLTIEEERIGRDTGAGGGPKQKQSRRPRFNHGGTMLCLSRRVGERIIIGNDITITVVSINHRDGK